jgi:hypothetical protein
VILTATVAAAVRLWTSAGRDVLSSLDEMRYLAMARTIGQDPDYYTFGLTYRPGFAVLVAPFHWFVSDPGTLLDSALLVNAVLGGISAALLVLIAARTALPFGWCCVAGLLAALAPGAVLQTMWASPESLMLALVLGTILATMRLVERPSPAPGIAAVALSAAGYLTHGRLSPLIVSTSLIIVVLAWRRRLAWPTAGLLLGLGAVLTLAAQRLSSWAVDVTWVFTSDNNSAGTVLGKLTDPVGIAITAVGMSWYQLVTTIGVAGCGAWLVGQGLLRRPGTDAVAPSRADAAVVVAQLLPLAGITAVFISEGREVSQQVYGRYWDALSAPILLYGIAVIGYGGPRAVRRAFATALAALAVCGLVLWITRQGHIDDQIEVNGVAAGRRIMGLLVYLGPSPDALPILAITGLAAALLLLLAAVTGLRWWRPPLGRTAVVVVLGVLAMVSIGSSRDHHTNRLDGYRSAMVIREIYDEGIVPDDAAVELTVDLVKVRRRWQPYQFFLPDHEIAPYDPARPSDGSSRFVLSLPGDARFTDSRAERVWRDPNPNVRVVLWRVPPEE